MQCSLSNIKNTWGIHISNDIRINTSKSISKRANANNARLFNLHYNAHFNFTTNNRILTYNKQRFTVQRIFSARMININDGSAFL